MKSISFTMKILWVKSSGGVMQEYHIKHQLIESYGIYFIMESIMEFLSCNISKHL